MYLVIYLLLAFRIFIKSYCRTARVYVQQQRLVFIDFLFAFKKIYGCRICDLLFAFFKRLVVRNIFVFFSGGGLLIAFTPLKGGTLCDQKKCLSNEIYNTKCILFDSLEFWFFECLKAESVERLAACQAKTM